MSNPTQPCPSPILDVPAHFCRELRGALISLKARLQKQYELALPGRSQLIREVVAEAEELAWQTPFPHLVLSDYAEALLTEWTRVNEPAFARAA